MGARGIVYVYVENTLLSDTKFMYRKIIVKVTEQLYVIVVGFGERELLRMLNFYDLLVPLLMVVAFFLVSA